MITLPSFRAATVQAAPVYLDTDATVSKACDLIAEASRNGARLVAFPEVFVPGYPYWNWIMTPLDGSSWFERLVGASVLVDGPEVDRIQAAACEARCHVVIGINERDPNSYGTLYNTTLFIDDSGELLGVHRKLVPTWAEKLTWGYGDGSSLRVYDTAVGPLGGLACGENTNTLSRFALLAQGELVHVANYIALPTAPADYDMVEAIKMRSAAHSFEGKVFTIVSCSVISEDMINELATDSAGELLRRKNCAFSGIFGPDGRLITDPLVDIEGIRYADIDLNATIQPKQMHDIVGHYNRPDVLQLQLNARRTRSLEIRDLPPDSPAIVSEPESSTPDSPGPQLLGVRNT